MSQFLTLLLFSIVVLPSIGYLADKRAASGDRNVTPGISLLHGDIKYESQDGRVKVYLPVVTLIMLSIVLSMVLQFFQWKSTAFERLLQRRRINC